MSAKKGILVNYRWCDGCHVCELACEMENGFEPKDGGIRLRQIGPLQRDDGSWQLDYIPELTEKCHLCPQRQAKGKLPACVQLCQSNCLQIVEVEAGEEIAARHDQVELLVTR